MPVSATEKRIHASSAIGNDVVEKIIAELKKDGVRVGKVHPGLKEIHATDIWYETPTFGKTIEVKCSNTSPICPKCKKENDMHQEFGCVSTAPFIPSHRNCGNRIRDAAGGADMERNSLFWTNSPVPYGQHFLFIDLCGPTTQNEKLGLDCLQRAGVRVMVYNHAPSQEEIVKIADWIRTQ